MKVKTLNTAKPLCVPATSKRRTELRHLIESVQARQTKQRILLTGRDKRARLRAARAIASKLNRELHRVDLEQVASKYIGETEKNLTRMFAAARRSGAILFFDEADALFGKRTTIKDSHDRYANQEVSYLLNRIEKYRGLVILATNRRPKPDAAFPIKLQSSVHFPLKSSRS
jgi:vesicle-fusing ATPase